MFEKIKLFVETHQKDIMQKGGAVLGAAIGAAIALTVSNLFTEDEEYVEVEASVDLGQETEENNG